MTTLTGGHPTPCCVRSNIDSSWISQLDQPGHSLALDTLQNSGGATYLDYSMIVDETGYAALWEVPSVGPVYVATARHCAVGPTGETCAYSAHQFFDSMIDGQPMPEPGTIFGLLLGALLLYAFREVEL